MEKIYWFEEIESTNEFAKTLVKEADEWTVVAADKQTKGKGRLGRNWYSPDGGLWFSVILKPTSLSHLITLVVGVAICEAMKELKINTRIKWPNDILIGGKKVAGILTEIETNAIIVGIGINLNVFDFPDELGETATSILIESGKVVDKKEVFLLVLNKLKEKYNRFKSDDIGELLNEWRIYSTTIGKIVSVETPSEVVNGEVVDIDDEDGALLLRLPTGVIKKIFAGKCKLIR